MRIKTKINLTFIVTAIISFLILGYLIEFYFLRETKKVIYSYLSSSGRARAEHIITFTNDQKTTAKILAAASVYRDFLNEPVNSSLYPGIKKKIDDRLIRTLKTDPNIFEAFILDRNGKIVASSNLQAEGTDKSQDDYFIKAKADVYFKDIYFSSTINKLNYTVSSPVTDNKGTFIGVSVLRYLPNLLYSIATGEYSLGETEESFLINEDKYLITPTKFFDETNVLKTKIDTVNADLCFDKAEVDYITQNGYSGLKDIATHQDAIEALDYRKIEVIATHTYIPKLNWCLITKVDKADALKSEYLLLIKFWSYIMLSLIIFVTIILLFINKIIKSILAFIGATKIFSDGDVNYRISVKTKDEIGELGESFNHMANAVAESRAEIENKVEEQTREIKKKVQETNDQKSAILNILEDVEIQKKKVEALADDLEKFKLALDNASDQAVITDVEGIVIYGNRAVEKITGFKPEEALGKKAGTLWKVPMPQDYYKKLWDIIKNQKKTFVSEIQNKRKNGEIYTANISISPILNDQGQVVYFVAIEHDITKEKEIDKAKSEFVSLASHQLRTPLSSINWYTEMLLNGDAGGINENQKKYLEEVYVGSQRMVTLVNSLLNVSRLDLGTFIIDPILLDVPQIIKSLLEELKPQLIERKQTVTESYEDNLPTLLADQGLLRMILQNLLSNAVKYGTSGGTVMVDIRILKIGSNLGGKGFGSDSFLIKVSDSGIGIPKSQQDKIFNKLFRADNAKQSETEGTGLGLYIIKSIVDQAGGEVWFESEENKGTSFYVSFPLPGMKRKEGQKPLD